MKKGLALIAAVTVLPGCPEDNAFGDLAEQCGLDVNCEAGGFAEGKASISGIAEIDAFFGAAIDLEAAMTGLSGELRAELDAIGASVGAEPGASGADLKLAIESHLAVYISGSLSVDFQPAKCQASVEASVAAAAECDAMVEPGMVTAKCSGSCELDASAMASCSTDATLMCSGTAPELDCSGGTCTGSCTAEVSAEAGCSGTCRGSCTAGGSTMDNFEGRCDGECTGECAVDMSAGGSCDAKCEGNCEYTAPESGCEADATASCEANAGASIECDAGCEGNVEPPEVSAECEATVDAKASASLECTPPTLAFGFDWNGDAMANLELQAEFRAWLEGFRIHFGAIIAARAKAEVVGEAALSLIETVALGGNLAGVVGDLAGEGNLKAAIGANCALGEFLIAGDALVAAGNSLAANVDASASIATAF